MTLFKTQNFISAAGLQLDWKIECDSLTDEDWETIAKVGSKKLPPFGLVYGIPTGGLKLARAFDKYRDPESSWVLVVDDVYTTGQSMKKSMGLHKEIFGFVAFYRGLETPPHNIYYFAKI